MRRNAGLLAAAALTLAAATAGAQDGLPQLLPPLPDRKVPDTLPALKGGDEVPDKKDPEKKDPEKKEPEKDPDKKDPEKVDELPPPTPEPTAPKVQPVLYPQASFPPPPPAVVDPRFGAWQQHRVGGADFVYPMPGVPWNGKCLGFGRPPSVCERLQAWFHGRFRCHGACHGCANGPGPAGGPPKAPNAGPAVEHPKAPNARPAAPPGPAVKQAAPPGPAVKPVNATALPPARTPAGAPGPHPAQTCYGLYNP